MMINKKVIITGAAGFLGSHLCERFLKDGYSVLGLDNLITGEVKNIDYLINYKNFEFIKHDITKKIKIKGKIDYILHFASPASPIDYLKIPIETLKVGSYGTHNCLEIARDKKARILVASTSEVYGDPEIHPQKENYWGNVNPIGLRSVYDEAKRYMEALTMSYSRTYNLDTRIVRIFNTYGPRMRLNDGRALPNFISQAIRGENLTVFGDGSQTRSFCYVDDLIEGIIKLLLSDYIYPVNIGNPEEVSLIEFANEIIKLTKSSSKIEFLELPVDDPKRRKPNIDLAKKLLNWSPNISRNEGLIKTYNYFKKVSLEKLYEPNRIFKN